MHLLLKYRYHMKILAYFVSLFLVFIISLIATNKATAHKLLNISHNPKAANHIYSADTGIYIIKPIRTKESTHDQISFLLDQKYVEKIVSVHTRRENMFANCMSTIVIYVIVVAWRYKSLCRDISHRLTPALDTCHQNTPNANAHINTPAIHISMIDDLSNICLSTSLAGRNIISFSGGS